jgi:hypothetical protein
MSIINKNEEEMYQEHQVFAESPISLSAGKDFLERDVTILGIRIPMWFIVVVVIYLFWKCKGEGGMKMPKFDMGNLGEKTSALLDKAKLQISPVSTPETSELPMVPPSPISLPAPVAPPAATQTGGYFSLF